MEKAIKIGIILALVISVMFGIYKLSGMNSQNSNGKSTSIISWFIEDTLEITNDYGITNSHPSEEKLEKASNLINAPMRKVIHASVYFVLAFMVLVLLNILFDHKKYFLSLFLAFAIAVIFAITDEYHQTFVAGRTGQIMDVLIDSIGAIIGILFHSTYQLAYFRGYKQACKEKIDQED